MHAGDNSMLILSTCVHVYLYALLCVVVARWPGWLLLLLVCWQETRGLYKKERNLKRTCTNVAMGE